MLCLSFHLFVSPAVCPGTKFCMFKKSTEISGINYYAVTDSRLHFWLLMSIGLFSLSFLFTTWCYSSRIVTFIHHLHWTLLLILIVYSRLDRDIQSAMEMLPLKRVGVLHTVLTAPPTFVGYASCWHTCWKFGTNSAFTFESDSILGCWRSDRVLTFVTLLC